MNAMLLFLCDVCCFLLRVWFVFRVVSCLLCVCCRSLFVVRCLLQRCVMFVVCGVLLNVCFVVFVVFLFEWLLVVYRLLLGVCFMWVVVSCMSCIE